MINEFPMDETVLKFDRVGRAWATSIGGDNDLIRYVFKTESESRTPFGAIETFLKEGRMDAILTFAAMYAEMRHKELSETGDEDLEEPKPRRSYKKRKNVDAETIDLE